MNLLGYLERIQHHAPVGVDAETLMALHRAHLTHIPYENLEIHFGRPLGLDVAQVYEKIVEQHRGGWCFEMNALFAWALTEIGFDVQFISTRVGTPDGGFMTEGDHVALLVQCAGQTWLADVGFGNGLYDPIPLREGQHQQGWLRYGLYQDNGRWVFTNQPASGDTFDFLQTSVPLAYFAPRCAWLQSNPESGFVRQNVCQIFTPIHEQTGQILTLRGAVLTTTDAHGKHARTLGHAQEFTDVLHESFGIKLEDAATLWPKIWQRHETWQASLAVQTP